MRVALRFYTSKLFRATNNLDATGTGSVTLTLTDENDVAPVFSQASYTSSVTACSTTGQSSIVASLRFNQFRVEMAMLMSGQIVSQNVKNSIMCVLVNANFNVC